jgi:hypothetical protein
MSTNLGSKRKKIFAQDLTNLKRDGILVLNFKLKLRNMKKNLLFLMFVVGLSMIMASCSSNKMMGRKFDGHNVYRPEFALKSNYKKYKASKIQASKSVKSTEDVTPQVQPIDNLESKGYASLSSDAPKLGKPMEMFKRLTAEEREVAKAEISKIFDKNPTLSSIIDKKFEKLDKKYPAPAQSSLSADGKELTTAEILSIVAIALSVFWVLGLAGLIIGAIALKKLKKEGGRSWARILSIIAIVLGSIMLLSFIIWLAVFLAVASTVL